MKKQELIAAIAEKTGLLKKDVAEVLDAYAYVIEDSLKKGDTVAIAGFGAYELKVKEARQGFNPATKQPITIAASKTPVLKFGKAFKDAFN